MVCPVLIVSGQNAMYKTLATKFFKILYATQLNVTKLLSRTHNKKIKYNIFAHKVGKCK